MKANLIHQLTTDSGANDLGWAGRRCGGGHLYDGQGVYDDAVGGAGGGRGERQHRRVAVRLRDDEGAAGQRLWLALVPLQDLVRLVGPALHAGRPQQARLYSTHTHAALSPGPNIGPDGARLQIRFPPRDRMQVRL